MNKNCLLRMFSLYLLAVSNAAIGQELASGVLVEQRVSDEQTIVVRWRRYPNELAATTRPVASTTQPGEEFHVQLPATKATLEFYLRRGLGERLLWTKGTFDPGPSYLPFGVKAIDYRDSTLVVVELWGNDMEASIVREKAGREPRAVRTTIGETFDASMRGWSACRFSGSHSQGSFQIEFCDYDWSRITGRFTLVAGEDECHWVEQRIESTTNQTH